MHAARNHQQFFRRTACGIIFAAVLRPDKMVVLPMNKQDRNPVLRKHSPGVRVGEPELCKNDTEEVQKLQQGKRRQMKCLSALGRKNTADRGKSAVRNNALYRLRKFSHGRKQNGCAPHGDSVQINRKTGEFLRSVFRPCTHIVFFLCAERDIFTLALPAAALCDKQNCTVFGVKPSPLIGKVMFCTAAESVPAPPAPSLPPAPPAPSNLAPLPPAPDPAPAPPLPSNLEDPDFPPSHAVFRA